MSNLFKTLANLFSAESKSEEKIKRSQNRKILYDLLKGDKLTPIDCLRRYGSFRAYARMYDLRQRDWNIITTMIKLPNGKRVAQYSLGKKPE